MDMRKLANAMQCNTQTYPSNQNMLSYTYTVNLRISDRGAYFKFRKRRGTLIGRGVGGLNRGGRLFNFSQIVA